MVTVERKALTKVAVMVSASPPSVASPSSLTDRFTAFGTGSWMLNDSSPMLLAPPSRPVPEFSFSVPGANSTVSPSGSSTSSVSAVRRSTAILALAPDSGPVTVTLALPLFRFWKLTPRAGDPSSV